ncbi:zinc finger, C2H2 type family protein [Collimonas fungivorans]|uniref:Zinc finger, C2H2 type family protein n=1 Tax=Collimonas fungivorans TaxID=158899 RepID=A0A127PAQ7_9BURK|nr:DUF4157 domain-containing protein [Collimonas fungivorans]AMO94724.1 zinc finger, C2H2 type family protein [Collimonas fungivorans]
MAVKPALEPAPARSLASPSKDLENEAPASEDIFTTPFGNYRYSSSPLRRPIGSEALSAAPEQKSDGIVQRAEKDAAGAALPRQPLLIPNHTGLPDSLKSGIEDLSGLSFDNVKVHYNSPQPAQLNALAYTRGTEIHVAPGQERHLPHEAWHVVQQAQGRVAPTTAVDGVALNDEPSLEHEADQLGATLSAMPPVAAGAAVHASTALTPIHGNQARPVQRVINFPDKVEVQYTKNTYLTKLWKAAQKISAEITFDQVRRAWIEAEASGRKVDLPDNIDLAWQGIAPYMARRKARLRLALDDEAELAALDEAGSQIPMTERTGLDKHRASVRSNAEVIFPAARVEQDDERRTWDPRNPAEFETKLPTVDYTTWDNLLDRQKRFLLENQSDIKALMGVLQAEVELGNRQLLAQAKLPPGKKQSKTYSDYIVALFSHLAVATANPQQVAKDAGIADGGKYLSAVFNVRRGEQDKSIVAYKAAPKTETDAERKALAKGQPPIDWLNEVRMVEMLREDAPFLRQRARQVAHLKKNLDEFDILKKWASGGSNVQDHNSNMDSDVLTTIATTAGAKDKQSPIASISLLDSLLAKITPVEGTVYAAYPRNDSLRVGYLFSLGTPMSASESAGGTVAFSKNTAGGADRYKIYATGHNGIPISAVVPGVGQGQREVLFRAQATFKVLSIEGGDFGANVKRQITMVEQGAAVSRQPAGRRDDKTVQTSQETLLNQRDKWITKFAGLDVDAETQAWFISNNTADRFEGRADASFAFPYGKKTAQAWHDVITNSDIDIWSMDGFIQIAARLLGNSPAEIKFIVAGEDPGSWGEAFELPDKDKAVLIANGLLVDNLYSIAGALSQELFAQVAARAGAEFSVSGNMFRLRLTAKQVALISGRWKAIKEKSTEKDGTAIYKISQQASGKKGGKLIKGDMEAAGQMKTLLVSLAGGTADGMQVPLSAAAVEKIKVDQEDEIAGTKKSKVSYQNEDKRTALAGILKRGAESMAAINAPVIGESREEGYKLTESAKLAARIQQQLSVLHPLHDGNGRISRAYAYLVLRRQGFGDIPLPLFDQDRDQSTAADEWENQFAAQATGGVKEKGGDSGPAEEIPAIASEADALKFMQVYAGDKMKGAIQSANAEQEKMSLGKSLQADDMWLVDEMLKYIGQRPEWLSKELKKDMDDLRRKRDTESTTNMDVFKQTLALKKRLVLEITEKMRKARAASKDASEKPATSSESLTPDSLGKKKEDAGSSSSKGEKAGAGFVQASLLDNPDFAERLNLQMQSATAAVALGGQDQLADDVLDRYDERTHGVQAHLIAYMVLMNRQPAYPNFLPSTANMLMALDAIPSDTIHERLNTVIIPRALMFFTWEQEVEQAELRWVQNSGLGAGVLWQEEMNYRTRLARAWVERNPDYGARVDAAQRTIVTDALGAAERARLQGVAIATIDRSFVNGAQLTDGNCLFAALAAPGNVNLESANAIRANVVAGLQDADVANTPLAELRQLGGSSPAARQARLAYDAMRDQGISVPRYQQYMGTSGVWGGDPEIRAWTRLHAGQTVYLLEPGNVLFRGISNAAGIGTRTVDQVLAAVNLGTAIAIRNTGGHYIRLLPRPQQQAGQAALPGSSSGSSSGPKRKRKSSPKSKPVKSVSGSSGTDLKKRGRSPDKEADAGEPAKKAKKELFACQEKNCGKSYTTQSNLTRHRRTAHGK